MHLSINRLLSRHLQAIDCLVNLLLNRGDALLVERFCYSHALEAQFVPRGLELVPVPMDAQVRRPTITGELKLKCSYHNRHATCKHAPGRPEAGADAHRRAGEAFNRKTVSDIQPYNRK